MRRARHTLGLLLVVLLVSCGSVTPAALSSRTAPPITSTAMPTSSPPSTGSVSPAPTTTATPTVLGGMSTSVVPLFLGPEVGVVAAGNPSTGCSTVYWTADFAHWRIITPPTGALPALPGLPPRQCLYDWTSASFVSADDGWILGRNGADDSTVLFHTLNGGRSWTREPGGSTGSNGGYEVIGFASADVGWRQQFAIGSNAPWTLELTRDAGVSWSRLPGMDAHGGCASMPVVFANAQVGFAAAPLAYTGANFAGGLLPAPWVWRTTDGGGSWTHLTVAAPPALVGAAAFYGQPRFFAGTGVLPVAFTKGSATWVAFYRSRDAGISWHLQTTVATHSDLLAVPDAGCQNPTTVAGAFPVVAIAGPQTWWVLGTAPTGTRTVAVTTNGGGAWTSVTASGIPAYTVSVQEYASQEGFISSLRAASGTRAWLTVTEGVSLGSQAAVLLETRDGGRTWSPVAPSTSAATPSEVTPSASRRAPTMTPTAVGACTANQLTVNTKPYGEAMHQGWTTWSLTNTSRVACTVPGGLPQLEVDNAADHAVTTYDITAQSVVSTAPLTVAPDAKVWFLVVFSSCENFEPVPGGPFHYVVTLPESHVQLRYSDNNTNIRTKMGNCPTEGVWETGLQAVEPTSPNLSWPPGTGTPVPTP